MSLNPAFRLSEPLKRPGAGAFATVGVLYFLGAEIGSRLTLTPEGVSLLWFPNAVLLAALLRYHGQSWWAFAACALVAEVLADLPRLSLGQALVFGGANVVEASVAWLLLQAWGFDPRFERVEDVGKFLLAAPLAGALIAATMGVAFLQAIVPLESSFLDTVFVWWFGDGLGLLVFTPLYLSFWAPEHGWTPPFPARPLADAVVGLLGVATFLLLAIPGADDLLDLHLRPILLLPFLLYASIRLSFQWTCVVVMLVSLLFVGLTVAGHSPYGPAEPALAVVWTQEFVLVSSVTTLGLSSLLAKTRHDAQVIRQNNRELRQRTEALQQGNAELRRIAFVAAHDLQTPLRGIVSFSQLLQSELEGRVGPVAADWVERVGRNARRLEAMLRDLGTLAAVDARDVPFGRVGMSGVFDEVVAELASTIREAGAVVTRDLLPVVYGDREQLVRLLKELLCNAIKFAGPAAPTVHVSARAAPAEWEFSVRDNGIGVPAEAKERVFELFYRLADTAAQPGTGFGLALCARVVHRHGGRIWIESAPGEGCTVRFTLPHEQVAA